MSSKRSFYYYGIIAISLLMIGAFTGFFLFGHAIQTSPSKKIDARITPPPINIYAHAGANQLAAVTHPALYRVYVPNSLDNTVSVIDPSTYQVVETLTTGKQPQHVVPAYDLQTLLVLNNKSNSITPINPNTAKPLPSVHVDDPYNLYFTPDGQFAILVCEAKKQLQFLDPHTMALHDIVPVACRGANHMDFTIDNRYALVTCEFSGEIMKIDIPHHKVVSYLPLKMNHSTMKSMPQDIRLSPDGRFFLVADMHSNGVFLIDPIPFTTIGFIPTGIGTHGIYPSRDGKLFYVSNRGCNHVNCGPHGQGSVSVVDPQQRAVIANWPIPRGGSPDMGNVNANGNELWLSGRYDREVYVFDTTSGKLTHRIPVGRGPHGLTVWPQPGRYSLGHTGNMR